MFINQKANKLPLKQNNSSKDFEIPSKSQLLHLKCLNLTREKNPFFSDLGNTYYVLLIKAKEMNKRDQKIVCKEKKTDIKLVIKINGKAHKLPSLKSE